MVGPATLSDRSVFVSTAFVSLFVDFLLLTVVVPIFGTMRSASVTAMDIGILFAAKPTLQLLCAPAVGPLLDKGIAVWPLITGLILDAASCFLLAGFGLTSYGVVLAARCVQGVGAPAF